MNSTIETIIGLITIVFVMTSIISIGLGLTIKQVLMTFKNVRFVLFSILSNFIIIPAAAYLIIIFLPLDRPLQISIIIVACAAGAPVLPEFVRIAKGDVATSVGLMVLQTVITMFFLPIFLPLMLPGIEVGIWPIARTLLLLMLGPLVVAMFVRAKWKVFAEKLERILTRASTFILLLLMVMVLITKWRHIILLFGSNGILASFILVIIGFGSGYLLGGPSNSTKRVLSQGTGMRNVAAAMIVATQNFYYDVLVMVIVFKIIMLIVAIAFVIAWRMRSRKALA